MVGVQPYTTTTFLSEFAQSIQEAVDGVPESAGLQDEERGYLIQPAPNAIVWATGPQYANAPSLYKYTRSYQIVRDVFQLWCPICNKRGSHDAWGKTEAELRSETLLVWNEKFRQDACPGCGLTRQDLEEDGMLQPINGFHLCCGQRSGKSVTAAIIGCYVEHRVLTLAHGTPGGLHTYLGLDIKDLLEMTFLASNEVQGKDTIWAKYRAARADSPWFKRYTAWVSNEEKNQVTPPGMQKWVYSESSKVVRNEHPDVRLVINSLNSNSDGLRGRTRIFGGVDEIAFMKRGDSAMSADEIYRAVENSLQTVRSRTKQARGLPWLGLMCSVSSPRDKNDKAMRLLKEIENVPSMLAFHYATWEFNPFEPRENFEALYQKDPVGAERDFGANPPMAAHPLIWDVPRFRDLIIDPNLEPACNFIYPSSQNGGHDYIGIRMVSPKPRFSNSHYIVFDAGKNFDAFAGACAHAEVDIDPETGAQRTITVFDWVCRILPPKGTEVLYEDVFGLIKALKQFMPIQSVQFDQWNSTQLIQQIRTLGVVAEQHSLKNEDWSKFRQDAYAGRIRMFAPDPADFDGHEYIAPPPHMHAHTCALYEIEGLEEDPVTQKVYNPRKGLERGYNSNDVAQVIVHAHKLVQAIGYTKKQDDRSRNAARTRAQGDGQAYARNRQGTVFNPSRFSGAGRTGGGRGW